MNEIILLAKAKVKKGSESQLEAAMRLVMPPTHAEKGCLKYSLNRSTEDPSLYVMIEKWASKEALDAHLASPYIQDLFKKLLGLLASPMELQIFGTISGGSPEKANL